MKKIIRLLLIAFCATFIVSSAQAQQVMDNAAVFKLEKAGLGDDLIVSTINGQPGHYSLSADDMIALKQAGVSDKVISAMVSKNAGSSAVPQPRVSSPQSISNKATAEADVMVVTPQTPLSQTKGTVTISLKPDSDEIEFEPKEHLEPYKPSLKEKFRIKCGDSLVSISTNNHYFKRTYEMVPVKPEAEGGIAIMLKNNGPRSIDAFGIPVKQKLGNSYFGLLAIHHDSLLGAIPHEINELRMENIPAGNTGFQKVYIGTKLTDSSGATHLMLGQEVDLMMYDVPVRFSNPGAVLERSNFTFRFRIDSKHIVKEVAPPPDDIVCKTS